MENPPISPSFCGNVIRGFSLSFCVQALSPPSEEEMTGRGCPFKIGFTWDPTEGRCAGRRRCKNGEEVEEEEEKENFFQTQDECMKWCAPIKEKRFA